MQSFCRDEHFRPQRLDEVGFAAYVAVEYGYALANAMRGVGIASTSTHEAEMSSDIERKVILLIGVTAVGDLNVVHKFEERMLGCRGRSRGTVSVEVLEEQVDIVGRSVEEIAERVRRNHHATGAVNGLSQACGGVHTVNVSVESEDKDVSHVGVDFECPDGGDAGIAECVCEFSLFPAAGVLGEANAVKSYALGFLYELFRG